MKWKKYLIQAGILTCVFVLALIVFSYITNRKNEDMTADIGTAERPQISFSYNGYAVNVLPVYKKQMDILSVRDTITPVADGHLDMVLRPFENTVNSATYIVYTLDGSKKLLEETVRKPGENVGLEFEDERLLSEERALEIVLDLGDDVQMYAYTRIIDAAEKNALECLDYVNDFHKNALDKVEDAGVGAALEPNEEGDNTTFYHVTIHSDYNQVTYGDMEPVVDGNERWSIQEMNRTSTSIQIEYRVRCKGEENEGDEYTVREFFRVRYVPERNRTYLLDYDRTMEQVFDAAGNVIGKNGITLGITDEEVPYLTSRDGKIVSFVQAREVWNYNKNTGEISLVFSFSDAENTDLRNIFSHHKIQLLDMDDAGNTTFAVYGYMNRGEHEGEVGIAVYYYDIEQNTVEERVFVESDRSFQRVVQELGKLLYYSADRDMLYILSDGVLYEVDVAWQNKKKLAEGLSERQLVVSEDGKLAAWQADAGASGEGKIMLKNLSTGAERTIECGEKERIQPLGFIKSDFVYGIARTRDLGKTASGQEVVPMYKVNITGSDGAIIKSYGQKGFYVLGAASDGRRIALYRATKKGGVYTSAKEDYITNNETEEKSNIYTESYVTQLKETQMRIVYADGMKDRKLKLLKARQMRSERQNRIAFEGKDAEGQCYVYGHGELKKICGSAGEAIQEAQPLGGVVVSAWQSYIWEKGNQDAAHSLPEESTELRTIRAQLAKGETPVEIMDGLSGGKSIDLTGCEAEQLFYILDRNIPVIAMLDSGRSVILTGYGPATVSYMDVEEGEVKSTSAKGMDRMTKGSGHTYVAYAK